MHTQNHTNFSDEVGQTIRQMPNEISTSSQEVTPEEIREKRSQRLINFFKRKQEEELKPKSAVDLSEIMPEPSGPHVELQLSLANKNRSSCSVNTPQGNHKSNLTTKDGNTLGYSAEIASTDEVSVKHCSKTCTSRKVMALTSPKTSSVTSFRREKSLCRIKTNLASDFNNSSTTSASTLQSNVWRQPSRDVSFLVISEEEDEDDSPRPLCDAKGTPDGIKLVLQDIYEDDQNLTKIAGNKGTS